MNRPAAALLLVLLTPGLAHADDTSRRAARVAELRIEVETLAARLRAERRRQAETRAAWAADAEALELAVVKARARRDALRAAAEAAVASTEGAPEAKPDVEALLRLGASLRARVQAGPPFDIEPRTEALDGVAAQLCGDQPGQAAVRLARFVRDERRLASTVGRARVVLVVDGEPRLLEVLRLGLVTLLAKLPDGRTGCTVPARDHAFEVFEAGEEAEAVRTAFDSYHLHPGGGEAAVPARCLTPKGATP